MNLSNVLTSLQYYSFQSPSVSGLTGWIASFINLFPSIAIGVIVFTIALKLISFPLDYFSRASMRKNSLKMEEMRPQLEKLQKQYANDKEKYNQKMMALYKKNGYSMFGSCLPVIITLVFFIIVLNSFNDYSNFQNVKYLYNMNTSYNTIIDNGIEDVIDGEVKYIYHDKEGKILINHEEIAKLSTEELVEKGIIVDNSIQNKTSYSTTNAYVTLTYGYTVNEENKVYTAITGVELDKAKYLKDNQTAYDEFLTTNSLTDSEENFEKFITDVRQSASAERFREENEKFLWVNNIWMPDTPFEHPVYSTYDSFNAKYKLENYGVSDKGQYDNLTFKLDKEKSQPNGYFILVLITAGSSLLMQLVSMKSNKAQMELQSVDGQGMQQQKIMMWMMPIMMAIFAFMYTAAFSLYIIMSSVTSLLSTLLINKMVDIQINIEKKKKEAENARKVYRK